LTYGILSTVAVLAGLIWLVMRRTPMSAVSRSRPEPRTRERQRLLDANVIESLARHGDIAAKPRPVDHHAYFATPGDRARFVEAVQAKGFQILQQGHSDRAGRPFWVDFERVDPVLLEHINPITSELSDLAGGLGGDYDGWGCTVTK